jgi:predicted nucleic acid-binding protein
VSYLLDAGVVAELARRRPDPELLAWLGGAGKQTLHMSVLSLGQLRGAIDRLPGGQAARERRRAWLERGLADWFGERLLPVTPEVAARWGALATIGSGTRAVEGLLAATALVHGLCLVVKGGHGFRKYPGLEVVSPWARA